MVDCIDERMPLHSSCHPVPYTCWTLCGSRRSSWIANAVPSKIMDKFGYEIKGGTPIMTRGWKILTARRFSDHQAQHNAILHCGCAHCGCVPDVVCTYVCRLQAVVCVRTVLHFVHLWLRKAKRQMLKRHARHVLLLLWSKELPLAIGYQIHECFRSNAKPQMQRPWLAPAIGTNGILAPMDCTGLFEMD